MPELDPDFMTRTIDPEKDNAVREWMAEEGWKGTESAVWRQDPDVGFWAWRHSGHGPPRILAIHEPFVRQHTAADLVSNMRLLRIADEIRREGKVRVWERGRVTQY